MCGGEVDFASCAQAVDFIGDLLALGKDEGHWVGGAGLEFWLSLEHVWMSSSGGNTICVGTLLEVVGIAVVGHCGWVGGGWSVGEQSRQNMNYLTTHLMQFLNRGNSMINMNSRRLVNAVGCKYRSLDQAVLTRSASRDRRGGTWMIGRIATAD